VNGLASARPPRDNLVRAMSAAPYLRDAKPTADVPSPMPTMFGHFARFNDWTEIDSFWEGNFMEQIAPGAFRKTIAENKRNVKVLFNHGQDPHIGDKVLGAITALREDAEGAYYEVPLFDTTYNRDLVPGLKANQYGASFRFRVMKEEFVQSPERSSYNPEGIPERTIKEVALAEFGPVTFPAYENATAGARASALRSLTDAFILEGMAARDPEKLQGLLRLRAAAQEAESAERHVDHWADAALHEGGAGGTHSEPDESRDVAQPAAVSRDATKPVAPAQGSGAPPARASTRSEESHMPNAQPPLGKTIEERRARANEIADRFQEIHNLYGAVTLPDDIRAEWEAMVVEREENRVAIADYEWRTRQLADMSRDADRHERVGLDDALRARPRPRDGGPQIPDNIYAVEDYRQFATSLDQLKQGYRDGAMRAIERASFPHPRVPADVARGHIQRLLDTKDDGAGTFAQRVLITGSPVYQRAFGKTLKGSPLNAEEQRALSLGSDPDGGFAVPFQLDPTVILASDGAINPLRQIARIEQVVGKEWMGVTSEGITASYASEAEESSDDSPTLVQPVVSTLRAQAFVPFSVELGQDWGALQSEMATLLSDAKDILEADKFVNDIGPTTEPGGIVATLDPASHVETVGSNAFAVADLYALEESVPPRFRSKAHFLANRSIYNKVRQFDTYGGAALWVRLLDALGNELIGYPADEVSTMPSGTLADGDLIMVMGDFSKFLIADRLGMSIELIPHLFGSSGRPTGQRGIYAIWRNSSVILTSNAFRVLKVKA
jgi:HK97 family phage major capsid protein/HK97 family phage prohead protease